MGRLTGEPTGRFVQRQLPLLTSSRFDVLVVGAGIHGLAIAYDAAARGLRTAMIDRGDLGAASSFNHAKTVHGGLRSLQTGDVLKARFSVLERRAIARIAPHLVAPLPFMLATTRKVTRTRLALRAAFVVDALVGYDRNRGVAPALRLPSGRVVSAGEYARAFAGYANPSATGGARWFDYQMAHADRLTFAFARAASEAGAVLATYTEARAPLVSAGRVRGISAVDVESGSSLEIAARLTINAAGSYARDWSQAFGAPLDYPLIRAMNVVTRREAGDVTLGAPTTDGRLLLLMPWMGRAMIGTSHSAEPVSPDAVSVPAQDLTAFLLEANQAFPGLDLTEDDVTIVHRGVVPARRDRHGRLGLMGHHLVRDHARDGVEGAVSVVGVKYTTARGVAEQVVDLAQAKLGLSVTPCSTGAVRLPGWTFESRDAEVAGARAHAAGAMLPECVDALVETYGTAWREIIDLCGADATLAAPLSGVRLPRAAVLHAIRHEMARTLADIVIRRTELGAAGYPGDAIVRECAGLAAREFGWDSPRADAEMDAVRAFYAPAAAPTTPVLQRVSPRSRPGVDPL